MAGNTKTTVNLSEASRITGINISTLKRHIEKGYLIAYQYDKGYGYKIRISDLEEYTFALYMNRKKFRDIVMYNPFMFFADLRDIVLNRNNAK